MTNGPKFNEEKAISCEICEAMCLDAADGTLTAAEDAAFERHIAGCVACAQQLAEARRGAAWMEMLKDHAPEPPAMLLHNILARTSGAEAAPQWVTAGFPAAIATPAKPAFAGLWGRMTASLSVGGGGQSYFQPRLAMTAAMAFFSIALTLNLTGIRLADLRPSALHRTVADVGANASRSFQSMKVVYQVESRVSELRSDDDSHHSGSSDAGGPFGESKDSAKPETRPQPAPEKKQPAPNGSSELALPNSGGRQRLQRVADHETHEPAAGTETLAMQKGA